MFDAATLDRLESVVSALRWLIGMPESSGPNEVLEDAQSHGLIDTKDGAHWKANGSDIGNMLRPAVRRMPPDSETIGKILHGLGEINARCHTRLSTPVRSYLRLCRSSVDFAVILDVAAKLDAQIMRPARLDSLAFSQWVSSATLDWTNFQIALGHIQRHFTDTSGAFGFWFVARAVLCVDRLSLDQWVAVHQNSPCIPAAGAAVVRATFKRATIRSILGSQNFAFRSLACAAIVSPVFPPAAPLHVSSVLASLVDGGIDRADAVWMAGLRIKEAVHNRYGLLDGREKTQARLAYIERDPGGAFGGARNADAEKRSLERQLSDMTSKYAALLPELEAMLAQLAAGWPDDGLSEQQLAHLENIFVNTPEIRFRLAEKLRHQGNREWLLKKNIDLASLFLGLKKPIEAFGEYLNLDDKFATITAPWTAQSIALYFERDRRGVGRQTSSLVEKLTLETEKLLAQPFIAARRSAMWQSAASRAACSYLLVLMVVTAVPETGRGGVKILNNMAIEHAYNLLASPLPHQPNPRIFDRLASSAVHQMSFCPKPDEMRIQWLFSVGLDSFPRALAIWSSPALVDSNLTLASSLFLSAGKVPLSQGTYDRQISNLLSLLDYALTSCMTNDRNDLFPLVTRLWAEAYESWRPITDRWQNAAADLIAALQHAGPERARFLDDAAFANSFCRHIIETDLVQVAADDPPAIN